MSLMQFIGPNILNTTTVFTTTSAGFTGTLSRLFDRVISVPWETLGYTSNTSALISIYFGTNTVISRVFLENHNLRQFRIFYDSLTANAFSPAINVSSNSETSSFFEVSSVTVQSIHLQIDRSIASDDERSIGELVIANGGFTFEMNPSIKNYKAQLYKKQIRHEMPDGGTKVFNIKDKFRAKLTWAFISETFKNQLFDAFEDNSAFYFVPFPTSTGWDGIAYEVVMVGPFDFNYGSNVRASGWSGSISIEETAGG